MAYFSNSSDGDCLSEQCNKCKYGQSPCPIFWLQLEYNYEAHAEGQSVAAVMLDYLIDNDGNCAMWKQFQKDLEVDPNQLKMEF